MAAFQMATLIWTKPKKILAVVFRYVIFPFLAEIKGFYAIFPHLVFILHIICKFPIKHVPKIKILVSFRFM